MDKQCNELRDFIGLMSGYALADYNRDYVLDWDPVVVKDHEVIENDDGSKTYRFEINDNLKWSDGSPITAKDYVFKSSASFFSGICSL